MSESLPATFGILISRDLMFISKITGTAQLLGRLVRTANGIPAAVESLRQSPGTCVCIFLDLSESQADPAELISRLPAPRPRVIAFGSHVATARLEAAKAAGCDEVLPRSRFASTLPDLLARELPLPEPQ